MNRKYSHQIVMTFQMFIDFMTVVISFVIGYYLYHIMFYKWQIGVGVQPFKIYRNLAIGSGFLFLIIFERFGLYSRKVGLLNVEEIKRIFQSMIIGSLILFSLSFLLRSTIDFQTIAPVPESRLPTAPSHDRGVLLYSRLIMMNSLLVLMILINFQRSIINRIRLRMHIRGPGLNRVLIYGAGEIGCQMQRRLFENPRIGLKPIGFIDDDLRKVGMEIYGIANEERTAIRVLGGGAELRDLIKSWDIHEVIITIPNAPNACIYEIINACVQAGVRYSFVPNMFDMFIQQVKFEEIEGIPLMRMKHVRRSYMYMAFKRLFDILFSMIFLLLFLPLLPIIIIAIRLDSKGSIFFLQERVGKDGKRFNILKFRSMYQVAKTNESSPLQVNDSRVTNIGRWLRRFSLDEVPQFVNVLKGDMSIVGPRPEMTFKVENYTPIQKQRLKVRPGITGIWQISTARSAEIHESLDYDFYYTENQSFLLDIVIILKTISTTIRGTGI